MIEKQMEFAMTPHVGDMVIVEYYHGKHFDKGVIEKRYDQSLDVLGVCYEPYTPFVVGRSIDDEAMLSVSGGPFTSAHKSMFEPCGETERMFCAFGHNGGCKDGAFNFFAKVRKWKLINHEVNYPWVSIGASACIVENPRLVYSADYRPYAEKGDLFNVYCVDVVSTTEGYDHKGQALGGWFGDGTQVGGNDARCIEYALGAVSEDRMDNTLIIVAMNSTKYAGTCWMHDSVSGEVKDYGCGTSVCYFPVGSDEGQIERLVHHEAGGHGFAKLADEYAYEYMGTVPQDYIDGSNYKVPYGWWKNGDFTNDYNSVKWRRFLFDERYQYDGLGCFEGAFTYWKGAWRPTDTSIMRYNVDGFNAPSREAIWYRMHKLAYGDSWSYDYEEFVAYDAVNRKTAASSSALRRYAPEKPFTPTAPPVLTGMTWRGALQTRPDRRPKSER